MAKDRNEDETIQARKHRGQSVRPNPFGEAVVRSDRGLLADVPELGTVLDAVLSKGCAIVIGRTRDGGAYSVSVLDNDSKFRVYPSGQGELDDAFQDLFEAYSK